MTIRLTINEVEEQFQETDEEELLWDVSDKLDITYKYGARFAQGWKREIDLREGIYLEINKHQTIEHAIIDCQEFNCRNVRFAFTLSGNTHAVFPSLNEMLIPYTSGKYYLRSNGFWVPAIEYYDMQPCYYVLIEIHPKILSSFTASLGGELPQNLTHLVRLPSQEVYMRSGDITPVMTILLQQILDCSYQGMVKRAYLEGKVIELMALVLDREVAIQQGEVKKVSIKPEQIERIHYAKEILLKDLSSPPSLKELAHKAGLNDFMLKQGFHHCFGTSVFRVLRDHRLEIAKQLLAEQDNTVAVVAHQIGYASVRAFARAFKKRFGSSPKAYQKSCQK